MVVNFNFYCQVIAATTVTAFVSGFLIGVLCMLMNMPKQIQAFEDEAQLKINEDNNRSGIEAVSPRPVIVIALAKP